MDPAALRPRTRVVLGDVLLAAGIGLLTLGWSLGAQHWNTEATRIDLPARLLIGTAAAGLAVRRTWPLVSLAVAAIATSTYLTAGYPYGPVLFTVAIAMYSVATRLPLRRALLVAGAGIGLLAVEVLVAVARGDPDRLTGLIPLSAWLLVPWALGVVVRMRREASDRARAEELRDHAYEERLRIAQEVHDVVGHGLAAINMQAQVALHVLDRRPEQAREALTAIGDTSKEALDELRGTLAVFRRQDGGRWREPGLDQLDALRDRMAATGLRVELDIAPHAGQVPVAVDIAAYRIVRESLTNVLRHARAGAATVRTAVSGSDLVVEISDDGQAPSTGWSAGQGVAGMRERARALGGSLRAGPRAGGGFAVLARLPIGEGE